MGKELRIKNLARLAIFLAALIWGFSFVVVKNTVDHISPNYLLAIRFTASCLLLAAVFYKKLKLLNLDYIWRGAVIGLCLYLAYLTQTVGITDTTPGKNAFLTAAYCVIVPFMFWAVNRQKPDLYNILAAALCIAGIGLVSLTQGLTIRMGDYMTILGGVFYAAHIVAVFTLAKKKDIFLIVVLQFGFCGLYSWIGALIYENPPAVWTGEIILIMVFLTVFCTALTLLLQNVGQKHLHPSSASLILSLEAVFGVLFSVLLYGEKMTPRMVSGFALIFIAVIISETKLSFLIRFPNKKTG